jgi:amino acid transporter
MKKFLLPHYCKTIGTILVLIGIVFSVLCLKFDFNYTTSAFALISIYLENRFFIITQTNIIDEITLILFVVGFGLIVFSKEKNEVEYLNALREKAFINAIIVNTFFILFSILFIYGGGFLGILVFNLFSVFIFYLIFFYLSLKKNKQETEV